LLHQQDLKRGAQDWLMSETERRRVEKNKISCVFLSQVFKLVFSQFVLFCFLFSVHHAVLLFGSVSDHFGPSAFNEFGFGFG